MTEELTGQAGALLIRYEALEEHIRKIRTEHRKVLEHLDTLQDEQKEVLDLIKKTLHSKEGPPEGAGKTHTWAAGNLFRIDVQYKKHADYYEPSKLPTSLLVVKGVVTAVDTAICNLHATKDPAVKAAWCEGAWMSSAVTLKKVL